MKKLPLYIFVFLAFLFLKPFSTYALLGQNAPLVAGLNEIHPMQTYTETKLCQVRRIFCGKTGQVIVAVTIFLLGLLIASNKISWTTAFFATVGMIVFYAAEDVAGLFGDQALLLIIENPMCSCKCQILDPFDGFQTDIQGCIDSVHFRGQIEDN